MTYQQYHRMVTLWRMGLDTYDIAKTLNLKESEVANRIASHLSFKKTRVAA
jgi:DNA-binding MarR family transcriptional regulator